MERGGSSVIGEEKWILKKETDVGNIYCITENQSLITLYIHSHLIKNLNQKKWN